MKGSRRAPHRRGDAVVALIGAFKFVKGLLLLAAGAGVVRLVHQDVAARLGGWIVELHVDPQNRYVDRVLQSLGAVDDRTLKMISVGMFVYAALLLTEGAGLLFRKRWAEYFTIVVTGSFIPLELYELAKQVTLTRMSVIGLNVAIVWYLGRRVRRERPGPRSRLPRGRPRV